MPTNRFNAVSHWDSSICNTIYMLSCIRIPNRKSQSWACHRTNTFIKFPSLNFSHQFSWSDSFEMLVASVKNRSSISICNNPPSWLLPLAIQIITNAYQIKQGCNLLPTICCKAGQKTDTWPTSQNNQSNKHKILKSLFWTHRVIPVFNEKLFDRSMTIQYT